MASGTIKTGQVELGIEPTLPQHAVRLQDVAEPLRLMLSVQAAGTAYTLTATPAKLNFGTTDPVLVLTSAGTYLFFCRAVFRFNAATFAANQTLVFTLRRTNNTPADVFTTTITLPIVTTETHDFEATLPVIPYVTAFDDDALELWGSLSVLPGAGTVDAVEASITAR